MSLCQCRWRRNPATVLALSILPGPFCCLQWPLFNFESRRPHRNGSVRGTLVPITGNGSARRRWQRDQSRSRLHRSAHFVRPNPALLLFASCLTARAGTGNSSTPRTQSSNEALRMSACALAPMRFERASIGCKLSQNHTREAGNGPILFQPDQRPHSR